MLLTGEYGVIDGAKALALPTIKGQKLIVKPLRGSDLIWQSYDQDGELWFESQISLYDFSAVKTSDEEISVFIQKLLKCAVNENSEFLNNWNGFRINTHLEFPKNWGLGSSSSLIYIVSQWAEINPFHLYFRLGKGSGYDIACAFADQTIIYQKTEDSISFEEVDFNPKFKNDLYFLYLNKKQNTNLAINYYTNIVNKKEVKSFTKQLTELTESVFEIKTAQDFSKLISEHENLVSSLLKIQKIKDQYFSDYTGAMKSLGAWGGDFALVVADRPEKDLKNYFKKKGFETILKYSELTL